MFFENYPQARLTRRRVLRVRGRDRGLTVLPVPRMPWRTPEAVHEDSSVVASLEPGVFFIVEWTGDRVELHRVLA